MSCAQAQTFETATPNLLGPLVVLFSLGKWIKMETCRDPRLRALVNRWEEGGTDSTSKVGLIWQKCQKLRGALLPPVGRIIV